MTYTQTKTKTYYYITVSYVNSITIRLKINYRHIQKKIFKKKTKQKKSSLYLYFIYVCFPPFCAKKNTSQIKLQRRYIREGMYACDAFMKTSLNMDA